MALDNGSQKPGSTASVEAECRWTIVGHPGRRSGHESRMRKTRLLLLMLLAGTPAFAQATPRALDAHFTLSFWGIGFGHIQYSNTLKGDAYAAGAHFETQGMVGFFWKSIIDAPPMAA